MSSDQDIPLEASETRPFTPDVFAKIEGAPSFTLGSPSSRQKRKVRKLVDAEGITLHSKEDLRAESLKVLKQNWSEEEYRQHAPRIEEYWEAMDDFQLQLREDPDAVFDWPEDEQERILQVLTDVQQGHQRLREMAADNAEYEEVKLLAILSSAIVDWEGLKTPCVKRNEIVEFDTLCTMKDELISFTEEAGLEPKQAALAWMQLCVACIDRERLTEKKSGNSASPAPSSTSQAPSTSQKELPTGTSPKSEASEKTPESA